MFTGLFEHSLSGLKTTHLEETHIVSEYSQSGSQDPDF